MEATGISSNDRETWQSRVASLSAFAESAPLDEAALATAAAEMLEDFTRTAAVMYRPERVGDGYGLGVWSDVALPTSIQNDFLHALQTSPSAKHFHYDPLRPAKSERNHVRRISPSLVRQLPLTSGVFEKNGIGNAFQTRVLVCAGPVLLSWVGIFREAASARVVRRDAWAVAHLARALRRPLRLLRRLPPRALGALFETALEALPGEAYLVAGAGRIQLANERGAARLGASFHATAREVADAVAASRCGRPSRDYEVHPVRHRHVDLYIVHRRLDAAARLALRLHAAAAAWGLTPQQSSVLAHLAHGRTNKEIAAALAISARTVEAHVDAVTKKAGAGSRLRLVAALWSAHFSEA